MLHPCSSPAQWLPYSINMVAHHRFEKYTQTPGNSAVRYTTLGPPWYAVVLIGQEKITYNVSWFTAQRAVFNYERACVRSYLHRTKVQRTPVAFFTPWPGHRNSFAPIDFCPTPLDYFLEPADNQAGRVTLSFSDQQLFTRGDRFLTATFSWRHLLTLDWHYLAAY